MKLAFLAPEFLPTWGGVGTYSAELVRNLCRDSDIEVHVITPRRGPSYNKSKILEYFDNKVFIHNISNANDGFFYNFYFQLSLLKNFSRLDRKYKFDLVHAANLVHMPDIYLKLQGLKIPSLTTIHTTLRSQSHLNGQIRLKNRFRKSTVERLTFLSYPYIKFLEKKYLARTRSFIAVSNWITQFVPDSNIKVIHNGIDTRKFSSGNKQADDFGFLEDINKPIVLYSGRLLAMKGLSTLIRSMKEVLIKHDIYFVFAGSGNIKQWEAQLKGVPKRNYSFLSYVEYEKMHALYAKSDIFVLPSYTESFPLTILEAMASGVPAVASKVGGIPEMIDDGVDGILVEPGNSEQLAEGIVNLLTSKALRTNIARNARKKVKEKFDSRIMAASTKKFYEEVLSKN
jgi:L-malate glycosyltransferase